MSDAVERFRQLTGKRRQGKQLSSRPPIPPREKLLAGVLLANVLWLCFSMGGMVLWGETTAALIAVGGLLLLPKWGQGELPGTRSPVYELLQLPLFWLGFLLFGLFFVHSWNVAWVWKLGAAGIPQMLATEPAVNWLPSGIITPLEENNPFRNMLFYAIPWLSACTAWAGLTTRRGLAILIHGTTLIGVSFALLAMGQHFMEYDKILGLFATAPRRVGTDIPFWGTLVNGNHAAYLLIIINGLCMGLFLSGWRRDMERFRTGGGIWALYFASALVVTFAILLAQSRAALGLTAVQWLIFIAICSAFFTRRFGKVGLLLPAGVILMAVATIGTFIINPEIYEKQRIEWNETFNLMENPELEARYYMAQITRDMIQDKPWYGHGAGSWRYTHLPYLANYPDFRTTTTYWKRDPQTRERVRHTRIVWFQNAHVDLAEYVVEWGWVGASLPLMAMVWLLSRAFRARRAFDLGSVTILSGVLLVWLGALVEFHFRIPLVLLVWCLTFTAVVRLAEREARVD